MKPYSEVSRFDLISTTGSFYDVGSPASIGETPGTFTDPLHNKTQIRFSLPVKNPVKMLANSSSIYYYNKTAQQWNIPTQSIRDHVGPFDKYAFPTFPKWSDPATLNTTYGTLSTEDAKGFDAYGRVVVSGSNDILRSLARTDGIFTSPYVARNQTLTAVGSYKPSPGQTIPILTEDYPKNIQRSSNYNASKDEVISIDIDAPFLLEKAVFEVPFALGSSWFKDRTVTCFAKASGTYLAYNNPFIFPSPLDIGLSPNIFDFTYAPYETGSFPYIDRGGPAITLSLFCQKNFGTSSIRDLILTGTITHGLDSKKTFIPRPNFLSDLPGYPSAFYGSWLTFIEPFGISNPAAIVYSGSSSSFTGSVVVKTEACISNGYVCTLVANTQLFNGAMTTSDTTSSYLAKLSDKFSNQKTSLSDVLPKFSTAGDSSARTTILSSIDAFGRGMSGFAPSGGSIFGGEYTTVAPDNIVSNPYYIPDASLREKALSDISSSVATMSLHTADPVNGMQAAFTFILDVDAFTSNKPSPYLLRPGDKLILAMSKTRPAVSASGHFVASSADLAIGKNMLIRQVPRTGSIDGHDVQLTTGSINITFYGSYVKEGKNYIP